MNVTPTRPSESSKVWFTSAAFLSTLLKVYFILGIFRGGFDSIKKFILLGFSKVYLLISTVLCLDTWILYTRSENVLENRKRKRFLLLLILLLPLLLLGGEYNFHSISACVKTKKNWNWNHSANIFSSHSLFCRNLRLPWPAQKFHPPQDKLSQAQFPQDQIAVTAILQLLNAEDFFLTATTFIWMAQILASWMAQVPRTVLQLARNFFWVAQVFASWMAQTSRFVLQLARHFVQFIASWMAQVSRFLI